MSRVAIVFTGGTIATLPDPEAGGNRPVLDGAAILSRAPELAEISEIDVIDWGLVPASHLRFAQLIDIARVLDEQLARPEIDGAVLVQGTDTIEETSFAFDLLIRSDKTVVVTGAMRDSSSPDYDGSRNLADSVRWAMDPAQGGSGVIVAIGGRMIPARDVVKAHATALDAFRAREGEGVPSRRRLPTVPSVAIEDVHLITATIGIDGTLLRLLKPQQPAGVVVAATGSGNTSADLLEAARELMADGTIVAHTTRCATGSVQPMYAFPGGGAKWHQAGALPSVFDGPKTRVALALGIAAGLDREALAALIGP
jgi:L-asparaginase